MKLWSFSLLVFLAALVLSCASVKPPIIADRSLVKYSTPEESDEKLVGTKFRYTLSFDSTKWKTTTPDSVLYKEIEKGLTEGNSKLNHLLVCDDELFAVVMDESRMHMPYDAIIKRISKSQGVNLQIQECELRNVNGNEILMMQATFEVDSFNPDIS